ncbi:hypothetical protein [Streptomyces sp. NPDC047108]|uniref:hypothetical protein n=1 Tax=Streptomyces sp. NPDC047108 TaxID=3155025 RepID=UPI0033F51A4B
MADIARIRISVSVRILVSAAPRKGHGHVTQTGDFAAGRRFCRREVTHVTAEKARASRHSVFTTATGGMQSHVEERLRAARRTVPPGRFHRSHSGERTGGPQPAMLNIEEISHQTSDIGFINSSRAAEGALHRTST